MKNLGLRSVGYVSNLDYNSEIGGQLIRKNYDAKGKDHVRLIKAIKGLENVVKKIINKRREWERPRTWEQIHDL